MEKSESQDNSTLEWYSFVKTANLAYS